MNESSQPYDAQSASRPIRSCRIQVDNKKLYLIPDTTKSNSANNSIKYATTTADTNSINYSHCTRNIRANSWLDQPMLFIPLSFPKSGLRFAEPPEQSTPHPQEVQIIETNGLKRSLPVAALFCDEYAETYVCGFGINDSKCITSMVSRF